MVMRFMAAVLIVVLAIGVLGIGSFTVRTVQYMTRQNFTIGNAIKWTKNDYANMIEKIVGTTKTNEMEIHIVVEDVKYLLKH